MRYITLKKLSDLTGYTEKALRSKIERGDFVEGVHYLYAPDGRVHFKVEEYERWVEGQRPRIQESRSEAAR